MSSGARASSDSIIKVILVDDHRMTHTAVSTILESAPDIRLVGEAANGRDAIELCRRVQPDIALMDVVMPIMDGIAATRAIREQFPAIKVLVLSSHQDHENVWAMLRSGAAGYITKGSLASDLVTTLRATYQGKAVFSPEATAQLLRPSSTLSTSDFGLTDRELEVLGLIAEGLNNGQIAHDLAISQSTVKFHLNNILGKFGVATRAEALVVAARDNLI